MAASTAQRFLRGRTRSSIERGPSELVRAVDVARLEHARSRAQLSSYGRARVDALLRRASAALVWNDPTTSDLCAHALRDNAALLVGCDEHADVRIRFDTLVSREHLRIWSRDGRWKVADSGSTNGTRIFGVPITAEHRLRDGDVIEIGGRTLLAFFAKPTSRDTPRAGVDLLPDDELTPAEREILAALSVYMRTDQRAAPATDAEVAFLRGVTVGTMGKQMKTLRTKAGLTGKPGARTALARRGLELPFPF